jgi:hypothetical protein
MLRSGTKVRITGFKGEEASKMNGLEGVIDHYSEKRSGYVVSLPGGPRMVQQGNLEVTEALGGDEVIFQGEEEMMERLKGMGMDPGVLKNLSPEQKKMMLEMTQRQDIVERAKASAGAAAPETELRLSKTGLYSWRDASEYVFLEVPNGSQCEIAVDEIRITSAGGDILVEGNLFQTVSVDVSKWELSEDKSKLLVSLKKAIKMRWLMVTR